MNGGAKGYYAEQQKLDAVDPEELGITSGERDAMKILFGASEQIYAQLQEREELDLELERIKLVQSEHNELYPPTNTGKFIMQWILCVLPMDMVLQIINLLPFYLRYRGLSYLFRIYSNG